MPSVLTHSFRPATEADLPFLLALRLATMAPHFVRQGVAMTEADHRQRAELRLDAASIIEIDGRAAGLLKLLRDDAIWTIEQLQVAPDHQGRGIGSTVLREIIAEACASGALLQLKVLKRNPAVRLYARLGFRTQSESEHSYRMIFFGAEACGDS